MCSSGSFRSFALGSRLGRSDGCLHLASFVLSRFSLQTNYLLAPSDRAATRAPAVDAHQSATRLSLSTQQHGSDRCVLPLLRHASSFARGILAELRPRSRWPAFSGSRPL